ncbi:hypothetical protein [Methylobacter sp. YRD-M1]|uniref:hypothetical protein n=1 Tax=Methylobacter sp. YRD-M1 TaxID=2911520 RepID=UPI00227C59AE|nr:hypothetical protein [Methylobacter sp. YRD-M1]WAK02513.1 hypothetical protein LZ558_01620 [Methylobacter sp. YRD-M1]
MDWQSQLLTLYPLGILDKKHEIKMLYDHADRYWHDWFPYLPRAVGLTRST